MLVTKEVTMIQVTKKYSHLLSAAQLREALLVEMFELLKEQLEHVNKQGFSKIKFVWVVDRTLTIRRVEACKTVHVAG